MIDRLRYRAASKLVKLAGRVCPDFEGRTKDELIDRVIQKLEPEMRRRVAHDWVRETLNVNVSVDEDVIARRRGGS